MDLWTAQYRYAGSDRVDITRGGAERALQRGATPDLGAAFAPSSTLLRSYKATPRDPSDPIGEHAWARYRTAFIEEMRASWRRDPGSWLKLLERQEATLCCFCTVSAGQPWCHRILVAELLVKVAERMPERVHGSALVYRGERSAIAVHPLVRAEDRRQVQLPFGDPPRR